MSAKFKGQSRWVNTDTGEIIEAQTIVKTAGDAGFHKIWLHHILEAVDEVGNAKMRVLMWLLTKANSKNQVLATHKEMAEACGCTTKTVQGLLRALKAADVITETRRSVWRLNPDVVFKGDHNKRMAVLIKYQDESQGDLFEQPPVEPEAAGAPLRSVA